MKRKRIRTVHLDLVGLDPDGLDIVCAGSSSAPRTLDVHKMTCTKCGHRLASKPQLLAAICHARNVRLSTVRLRLRAKRTRKGGADARA